MGALLVPIMYYIGKVCGNWKTGLFAGCILPMSLTRTINFMGSILQYEKRGHEAGPFCPASRERDAFLQSLILYRNMRTLLVVRNGDGPEVRTCREFRELSMKALIAISSLPGNTGITGRDGYLQAVRKCLSDYITQIHRE